MSEAVALVVLALCLAAAVARPAWAPEWAVTVVGALVLLAIGTIGAHQAWAALKELGPTVGFLAALLVLADGCRRDGLFEALGGMMARGSRGRPVGLLALVFGVAAVTTAVLSLDATIVLLTPVVFATTARLRANPKPPMYACSHLANSASLLLPVSNLTNLLAFHASGLSFTRFGALMLLPWAAVLAIEWVVLRRRFADDLHGRLTDTLADRADDGLPPFSLTLVVLALVGFAVSSVVGIAPVWVAVAAALATVIRHRPNPRQVVMAAEPTFLVFVLALGVIVQAASQHGLSTAVDTVLPGGSGFPDLLAIAAISAVLANLVNNLPATLIVLPAVAGSGPGALLAMLIGVNVGPNLTYVGSLATLLWRRIVHSHDEETDIGEFTILGVLTVPAALVACTACLWLALQVI
jgi:arsenical pump membrane protein